MSTNRENVVWLSPRDGLWYGGFFEFHYINQDSLDFDHEWDVEYDTSRSSNVTVRGMGSRKEALEELVAGLSNPGASWGTDSPEDGVLYDGMADAWRERGIR